MHVFLLAFSPRIAGVVKNRFAGREPIEKEHPGHGISKILLALARR